MTRKQIIESITREYLKQLTISKPEDIENITMEIVEQINNEISMHNSTCSKENKWKALEELDFAQIAMILLNVFVFRVIHCSKGESREHDILGLYVDDNVLFFVPQKAHLKGIYIACEDVIRELIRVFDYSITSNQSKEILVLLKDKAKQVERCYEQDYIAVNNGIFNYATKQLMPFSADKVFICKSRVDYNPNASNIVIHNPDDGTDWDVESWMESLAPENPEICNTLWEITGAILRPNVPWNKSAWLYSDAGNNGKGCLCTMYRNIIGDGAYASIALNSFGEEFQLENLITAQAIIVDENDVGAFIDKAANLKSVITSDIIKINRKYKDSIDFQFRGFMVQCLNEYPRIKDKSDSFFRRQLFIPMKACFTGRERKYIKKDYLHRKEVLEYILKRVLEMNYYTLSEPESCKIAMQEFKELNNPVNEFWSEIREEIVNWKLLPFTFLYDLYKRWFVRNNPNGMIVGKTTFTNDLLGIIKTDPDWECPDKTRQFLVTQQNMGGPEHLILDYGLTEWMNKDYKGNNPDMICTPKLKSVYRGIIHR